MIAGNGVFASVFSSRQGTLLNPTTQVITDAMLTEEGDFYMMSEDEENVYLQLIEED